MARDSRAAIVIADDHPLYREALTAILERASDLETRAPVDSLNAALEVIAAGGVTLALLDLDMPGMYGVAGIMRLRELHPDTRVAVISGQLDGIKIREVLSAGACGYLPKTFDPDMILAAVRLMLSGAIYVPPDALTDPAGNGVPPGAPVIGGPVALTPRELEVLRMLTKGSPNKEIARAMGIAEVTVKLHTRRIMEKLGVRNRAAAAAVAVGRGLIPS